VRAFVDLLERDVAAKKTEQVAADLSRIRNATATMDTLLRELLELSRVGRVTNPPETVPLAELAREAIAGLDGRLRAVGARVEIQPDLPTLRGDRVRLVEVLQNLIENAVKFRSGQAEPVVGIGSRPGPDGPVVVVRDNGIGIDPRYHERVFALFERLDPRVDGTGVGLALVRRIVEAHGGRVWVESEGAGKGSAFCFTVPPQQ
jgi:signal transduction histidine kinase